ncbi:hypothetical protein [Lactobacillus intestinalis]|uniref:hypothetical protein n=1 Tax=Lactobacillus intestinalis TaxID=151781 RepID=UPI0025B0C6C4|nr:hypothetical protein [Lactobacillus intestinalis]
MQQYNDTVILFMEERPIEKLLKLLIVGFIVSMLNISPSVSVAASQTNTTQIQPQEKEVRDNCF